MEQPREPRPRDDAGAAPEPAAGQPLGQAPEQPEPVPGDEPDFADEHTDVTFADQLSGGPEGMTESETPEGYAGMESRGASRRPGRDRD